MKHRGLGKGLSALLKEEVVSVNNELVKLVDIDKLEAGVYQPRKHFEYEKIKELADSIANSGLLHPIIVSAADDGKYKIIAGERRWRACKIAGFTDIPVIIKDLTSQEILRISLIENIQREELSAIEEAEGFARLIKEFNYTQEQLAEILSKSRSHIANLLRLNQLPQAVKDQVMNGQLTMGHARCLVGNEYAEAIANYIIQHDLNVRQAENIAKSWNKQDDLAIASPPKHSQRTSSTNSDHNDLELLTQSLIQKFGVKITIEEGRNGGKLIFHYETLDMLDEILSRLG
ncbi:ParB/RepB/Spo0J family partition protein [Candidatus Trichorickettsia mobilis]|uniref:Probable chromosome-partitioning protein ParB n=2 Tax=Candidatus Trichorickettsia mobilis TaxID=1346319 RepID=A0ABZ0URW6_9RICK|nr:ParB/RepB/Spo0J family partition protein [Candidatus Trichorickettsia mobilis]